MTYLRGEAAHGEARNVHDCDDLCVHVRDEAGVDVFVLVDVVVDLCSVCACAITTMTRTMIVSQ